MRKVPPRQGSEDDFYRQVNQLHDQGQRQRRDLPGTNRRQALSQAVAYLPGNPWHAGKQNQSPSRDQADPIRAQMVERISFEPPAEKPVVEEQKTNSTHRRSGQAPGKRRQDAPVVRQEERQQCQPDEHAAPEEPRAVDHPAQRIQQELHPLRSRETGVTKIHQERRFPKLG